MAYTAHVGVADGFSARLGRFFTRMIELGERMSSANRCRLEAERLSALSDAELAQIGLKRDEIMHHAFRRYLYL